MSAGRNLPVTGATGELGSRLTPDRERRRRMSRYGDMRGGAPNVILTGAQLNNPHRPHRAY